MKVRWLNFGVELILAAIVAGLLIAIYRTRSVIVRELELICSRSTVRALFFICATTAIGIVVLIITVIFPAFLIVDAIAAGILIVTYKRSRSAVRSIVVAVVFIFATIAAGIGILHYMLTPVRDIGSAVVQANQLMGSIGGPTKVCNDASRFFKRYRPPEGGERRELTYAELTDCPAIAALGRASQFGSPIIDSGGGSFPPYIEIRFGNHLNAYWIVIADTDSPVKFPHYHNSAELVPSCIIVYR